MKNITAEEEQFIEESLEAVDIHEEFTQIRGEYYWLEDVQQKLKRFRLAKRLKIKP